MDRVVGVQFTGIRFQIFGDDCVYCNRFSLMCTAEVSINIRNAFLYLEC
jgi:hypothetical protein